MNEPLAVGTLLMGLLGGLALFLYGMEQMTVGLKAVAGEGLKNLLAKLTTNRFKAAFTGAAVTAVIQSSSVTTVLLVGFISAGLITLQQSIGVIMGANIGSTMTAQIIAFKVTQYGLAMFALGFFIHFILGRGNVRYFGTMLMGIGFIFFGMDQMSDATHPLRSYPPFVEFLAQMDKPAMAILAGAVFTAIVQSSAATTGLVIVLASQGLIALETGIALAFGANIGTCVTALLASLGKPREAVQAAVVHVLFNVIGVLIWIAFIDELADAIREISPSFPELTGVDRLAKETPRQVANAHTVFNIANTLIFLPFTTPLAWIVSRVIPEKPTLVPEGARPKYLDVVYLETPAIALDRVRLELGRLGECVLHAVRATPTAVSEGSKEALDRLEAMDDDVDLLHRAIVEYLGELSRRDLTEGQSMKIHDYLRAANYLENMGDTIETNLVSLGRERIERNVVVSDSTRAALRVLAENVFWAIENSVIALSEDRVDTAKEVIDAKTEIDRLAEEALSHLSARLVAEADHRLSTFRIESDVVENLKRLYYFSKRVAKSVTREEEVESSSPIAD